MKLMIWLQRDRGSFYWTVRGGGWEMLRSRNYTTRSQALKALKRLISPDTGFEVDYCYEWRKPSKGQGRSWTEALGLEEE